MSSIDELEPFLLKHGESIVDMLGGEIDRIELKLKVIFIFIKNNRLLKKFSIKKKKFICYRKITQKYGTVIWKFYKSSSIILTVINVNKYLI